MTAVAPRRSSAALVAIGVRARSSPCGRCTRRCSSPTRSPRAATPGAHVALPWFLRTELLAARPAHGLVPGLVRRLPPLHLLLRPLRPARGARLLRPALHDRLQARRRSSARSCSPSAPTRSAGCFRLRAPLPGVPRGRDAAVPLRDVVHDLGGQPVLDARGRVRLQPVASRSRSSRSGCSRGACGPGRGVVASAVALSVTLAAHVLPWLWALVGIARARGHRPAARPRGASRPAARAEPAASAARRSWLRRARGRSSAPRSRRGGSCRGCTGQSLRDLDGLRERRHRRAR